MPGSGGRVLISGASVAGPVLAYWLARFGFQPTVVERTEELRFGSGGHAVDLFGPALKIIEWMGALPKVRDARTRNEIISLLRPGHPPVDVPAELMSEGVSEHHVEIMRGDLAKIAYETGRHDVEYLFGNSISALEQTDQALRSLSNTAPRAHLILLLVPTGCIRLLGSWCSVRSTSS
jgi:2-polyprenyl-6-methoxyphenol hydroxylase-like FAD-dependent oxidoreductase